MAGRHHRGVFAAVRRHPLTLILLLATGLRVVVTWGASAHHPDEIFQYLEQAHRLVFGYGYIPWEYREGMRSWLVPGALAGPMWLGGVLAPHTLAYLLLPRLLVALSTLGIVWGAWSLGERLSRRHAIFAALVAATWFEQVYFASHTLTETMATAAAIPGIALLFGKNILPPTVRAEPVEALPLLPSSKEEVQPFDKLRANGGAGIEQSLVAAGALLAFAAIVRFHYAPVLAFLVVWRCRLNWRAWRDVVLGALPVLALSALVDVASGMRPYAWIVTNIRRNVFENASATYGVSGPAYYLFGLRDAWGLALVPLAFLAIFGGRRYPQLLIAALLTIALHMAIGHKEMRFILLATTLILILAAIGTADLIALAAPARQRVLAAVAATGWVAASLTLAITGSMRLQWSNEAPALSAAARAGEDPKLCGLATYGMRYWQAGGYTFLHRDVPIYPLSASDEIGVPPIDPATLAGISGGFDAILTTPAGIADIPRGFTLVTCRTPPRLLSSAAERSGRAICLYRRPGTCDAIVARPWQLK